MCAQPSGIGRAQGYDIECAQRADTLQFGFDWVERFLEPDPKKHEAPELLLSLFIGPIHTYYAHRRFSTP